MMVLVVFSFTTFIAIYNVMTIKGAIVMPVTNNDSLSNLAFYQSADAAN